MKKQTKYVFITGGVLSGVGKGITTASLGKILEARGFSVNIQKLDQYLNTDAGTLNPAEHGEVFVTADGGETDLDLGHYERFIDRELSRRSSVMSGQIYAKVIADERDGAYLGKTVQIIPHVTGEIQRRILEASEGFDIQITEIGGTVGDMEGMALIEAIRQLRQKLGSENVVFGHVVYVPFLGPSREFKSKPAQNSVRDLREAGITPDLLFVRSEEPIHGDIFEKLSLFCDVAEHAIVPLPNIPTVYEVPLIMEDSGIVDVICKRLDLDTRMADLTEWKKFVQRVKSNKPTLLIGVVAKYLSNVDTYLSVFEAIKAAAWHHGYDADIVWIDAEKVEHNTGLLEGFDGIVVPGGFGSRGIEGKIKAAQYARTHKLPYLGLCLGMQVAVIEFARHVAELAGANSTEFDKNTQHPVIDILPDQDGIKLGGTMRLGNYAAKLRKGTKTAQLYDALQITERHRHRYEFNNAYLQQLKDAGLTIAGTNADTGLVEVIELGDHPFFVASQYHPEFQSRPDRAHPLFVGFAAACKDTKLKTTTKPGALRLALETAE